MPQLVTMTGDFTGSYGPPRCQLQAIVDRLLANGWQGSAPLLASLTPC
jgi:hypothetical protein